MGVEFTLLGGFALRTAGGEEIDLGHARQRCVLAALLMSANSLVTHEKLADRLWGPEPPERTHATLRAYVSRLRSALREAGDEARIERGQGGYTLTVPRDAVDLHRYRQLLARARRARDGAEGTALFEEAFALWRGEPFTGLESAWLDGVRRTLRAEHDQARLDYFALRLRRGEHAAVLAPLTAHVTEHPLDERASAQLMRALYASGRQADALREFERIRGRLAEELGADPGPETRRVHQQILTGGLGQPAVPAPPKAPAAPAAPPVRVPRQLPSDIPGFVGRQHDLAHLDALLTEDRGPDGPDASRPVVICAIDGAGGAGKTALAVHWAHRVKGRFPGGQLFVNLRGYGPGEPVSAADALESMLRSLGVPAGAIPGDLDERSALLRSELAGRRVLIILDNARASDQVRPLLPGGDALVLVTSRRKLRALSARHGARHLTLGTLPLPDALALFDEATGGHRAGREPEATRTVVELCTRLPLALRLAAERATRQPDAPLSALAAQLAHQRGRLAALSIDESIDTDLRSVFDWSYGALTPEAAALFDCLGHHPGSDTDASAAAALAGTTPERARALLGQLYEVSMAEQPVPGRFQLHDLLREYARDQAARHGVGARETLGRLLDWYVHSAARARGHLLRLAHRLPLPDAPPEGIVPAVPADRAEALAWFAAESDTIAALVPRAGELGHHRSAVLLAQLSWPYFYMRAQWGRLVATGEAALASALALGDPFLEAKCRNGLSGAYGHVGRYEEELATCRRALELFERLGHVEEQATALLNMGSALEKRQRYAEAREVLQRSRDLYLEAGDVTSAAMALNNLAMAYRGLRRFDEALGCGLRAAGIFRTAGEYMRLVAVLDTLAWVHAERGDHRSAIRVYEDALAVERRHGADSSATSIRVGLGHQYLALGNRQAAREAWCEALRYALAQEDREAAAEAARLVDQLDGNDSSAARRPSAV